jgi:hypothetical protein
MKSQQRISCGQILLAVGLIAFFIGGCSQKSVNVDNTPTVLLGMKVTEPGLLQFVDEFRLIVTGPGMARIETSLEYNDGYLEGEIQVPAGKDRIFTVLALDAPSQDTIYRGDDTLDIAAGAVIPLTINLYPQVDLIKLSPRFKRVDANSAFTEDVKVFNIDSLYGISFRILFDNAGVVLPDSAIAGNPNVLFLDTLDSGSGFYAFGITQIDSTTPLVNAQGNATLARIYFQSFQPEVDVDTAEFQIEVTGLTKIVAGAPINVSFADVYTDRTIIEVSIPDSVVIFSDSLLEGVVRDTLQKPSGDIYRSEVLTITKLDASELGITQLGGLSNLTNLEFLELDYNQISDLSELSALNKLGQLFLGWNNISDLSPLDGLPSIFELDLRNNQVTDIHALYDFWPNNTLGTPTNATDKVWLLGNPLADTAQVSDTLCLLSVGVFLTSPDSNWCSGL